MKVKGTLGKREIIAIGVFCTIFFVIAVLAVVVRRNKEPDWLVYADSLDVVVAEVNQQELTLRDLAFYIAYDEQVVEDQAEIYNPEDTTRYWNVCTNGEYIRLMAKDATMQKAIHDEIFYQMALKEQVSLTEEERDTMEDSANLFWNSIMYGDKLERLGVSEEDLNATIEKMAIAQKYQAAYAQRELLEMSDYDIATVWYEKLLAEQDYQIYEDVWDKVNYGDITLTHINGVFNEPDSRERSSGNE